MATNPKNYFLTHQQDLLRLANTYSVQKLLSTVDEEFVGKRVVKLTPDSVHILREDGQFQAFFFGAGSTRIAEILIPLREQIVLPAKPQPISIFGRDFYPSIGLTTTTFNPNTGEGETKGPSDNASWSTERTTATGDFANTTPVIIYSSETAGPKYNINRVHEPFDTSSIGAGATISSSFIKFYRDDTIDAFHNVDSTSWEVVKSQQASATSLATSDYSKFTNTSIGSLAFSSTTNGAYFQITISDQTAINSSGNTLLANITGLDLNNTTPTGLNEVCVQNRGNLNPPVLSVTYTTTLSVNVFDSATIAETITAKIPSGNANVFDSVTIAETVTANIPVSVNVFDSATIAETITRQKVLNISVVDNATIAETVTIIETNLVTSVFDSATIAETITSIVPSGNANVFDSVTINDTDVVVEIFDDSVFDNITVSENTTLSLTNYINVFDSVTIAENIQPQLVNTVSVFDSVTIAETVATPQVVLMPQVNDNITISEFYGIFQSLFAYTENWTTTPDTSTDWEDPL